MLRRNSRLRGSSTVDYLMITAAIAGVATPLMMRYFGQPLLNSLNGQRQTLVDFVSQERKNRVPSLWFAQDRVADPKTDGKAEDNSNITVGEPSAPTGLTEGGDPKVADISSGDSKVSNLKEPPNPRVARLKETGNITVGNPSGTGGGGGTGVGDNMDPDMFNNANSQNGGGNKNGQDDGSTSAGRPYGSGGGNFGSNEDGAGGGRNGRGGSGSGSGKDAEAEKSKAMQEPSTRQGLAVAQAEVEEEARSKAFNWWMLLKILLVLLILFLIVLITLGNMKRR